MVAAALVVGSSADAASANWITIKNDTGRAIVVQESVVVNGQVRRGKARNLLPGETYREFVPGPTVKRVEVFDAQQPGKAIWCGKLDCKDEKQVFSVTDAAGKVTLAAAESPTRK